jgi:uncharacterized protein YdhG (YjbR/CyaY superfamily)
MRLKAKTVPEYLAQIPPKQRAAIDKLRKAIQAAAPKAVEGISYGIPIYKLGKMLVGYGVADKHLAFYACSNSVLKDFEDDIEKFDTSMGTIRFQPEKPIPAALVKRIVKARIVENLEKARG